MCHITRGIMAWQATQSPGGKMVQRIKVCCRYKTHPDKATLVRHKDISRHWQPKVGFRRATADLEAFLMIWMTLMTLLTLITLMVSLTLINLMALLTRRKRKALGFGSPSALQSLICRWFMRSLLCLWIDGILRFWTQSNPNEGFCLLGKN